MAITYFRYPSLVNHYAISKEFRIIDSLDDEWYATEKINGSNAAYYLDKHGNESYAKRSTIFDPSKDKQFSMLPNCIPDSVRISAKNFIKYNEEIEYIIIYGEFFGSGIQPMDYDIVRSKQKTFRIFDVFIKKSNTSNGTFVVLGLSALLYWFKSSDMVPVIRHGSLKKLISQEPDEKSYFGGYSEGQVYKPIHNYIIDDRHKYLGVKHKTQKYLEVGNKTDKKPKVKANLSTEEIFIAKDLGRYITINRVRNVLSHGDYELIPQSIRAIMIAVKEDVITEYINENNQVLLEGIDLNKLVNGYSKDIAIYIKDLIREENNRLLGIA